MQKISSILSLGSFLLSLTSVSAPLPKKFRSGEPDFPEYLVAHGIEHALNVPTYEQKDFQKIYKAFIEQCPNCETLDIQKSIDKTAETFRTSVENASERLKPIPITLYAQLNSQQNHFISVHALHKALSQTSETSEFFEFTDDQFEILANKKTKPLIPLRSLMIAYEATARFGTFYPQNQTFSQRLKKWNSILQRLKNLKQERKAQLRMVLVRFQNNTQSIETRFKAVEREDLKIRLLYYFFQNRAKRKH